ncbi:Heparinase II/III family protein [Chloroherpeton thalassium ATCC 35110]|uniref:Heparinase II/III family protein n=1 Tax=Chloroherpeton thalassium (strain ATCC 35110 / GB-78) TaxID=517418 RepID=B3QVJ9_CHLT3|nr:heparinase II/III family protein [Chloroherpeton thalassium]ACF14599.1 Heparinase II/III family protein [Chloroherpeton thalassium ATCC 35110]
MRKIYLYITTIFKLGIFNVFYVVWYKFSLKIGGRKFLFKKEIFRNDEPFFSEATIERLNYNEDWKNELLNDANKIINGEVRYYAYHWKNIGSPPDWFLNPFNNTRYPNSEQHWTSLPDFATSVGDIKNVWEASRFEWVVTLARAYAVTGEKKYLNALNTWLADWVEKNPLNIGPNWKCGQEASIRLFNLLNASFILRQNNAPSESLKCFVNASLLRISKNIRYAISQDNNHGTSEAIGLFIGGLWLQTFDEKKYGDAKKIAEKGRFWLENRVKKLIADGGGFSQHSVTYHRVMLDSLCFAEFWRRALSAKPFSEGFYHKVKASIDWLASLTDEYSGNAPNLGSNDGAFLLNFHSCAYRDFRPTLQFSAHLFYETSLFPSGCYDETLYWMGLKRQKEMASEKKNFSSEGYTVLRNDNSWALIKWPFYKFRPSHNDVFHIDLWYKGHNVFCDAGSFSYNPDNNFKHDLKSVRFHNTVFFDGHEQMPKLSRFLLANWLKPEIIAPIDATKQNSKKWSGSYKDSFGNRHERSVEVFDSVWEITDSLTGNFKEAVIGFNLNVSDCIINGSNVMSDCFEILCPENLELKIFDTVASDYYYEVHSIKKMEMKIKKQGKYITKIKLKNEGFAGKER